MVLPFLHELDVQVRRHPSCDHYFLDRLGEAQADSAALRTFLLEFGLLRGSCRVLDARLSGSTSRFLDMARSCGVRSGIREEQGMPGTRLAMDGMQILQRDLCRREGALWAVERASNIWAEMWCFGHQVPNQGIWDGYWHQLLAAEPMVADPTEAAAAGGAWQDGLHQALGRLSIFLDGCEAAVENTRVA